MLARRYTIQNSQNTITKVNIKNNYNSFYSFSFQNCYTEIKRIAAFLNKDVTEEQISQIREFCKFDKMKNNAMANFSHLVPGKAMAADGDDTGLVRKGVVGDWRNHCTEAMRERIDRVVEAKLSPLGLTFDDVTGKWDFSGPSAWMKCL